MQVTNVRQLIEKINISGTVRRDELMSLHTTYRIGGPADIYAEPLDEHELDELVAVAKECGQPYFILGGGSNILVSDRGIRGLVINLTHLRPIVLEKGICRVGAGMSMSDTVEYACLKGWKGLEPFYAMPGSTGGAVWMNARCYDVSISDVLAEVRVLEPGAGVRIVTPAGKDFDYKKSPFQSNHQIILEALFHLEPSDRKDLAGRMEEIRHDRTAKGHFIAPSAGSVFKNNRAFGQPSGVLIDSLGLRGYRIGHACVSPRHANFIINEGGATARDVRRIIDYVRQRVKDAYGFELEPEVMLVGRWEDT